MLRRMTTEEVQPQGLLLTVDTWRNDSYGLFDYESTSNLATKRFNITGNCKIFRNWNTSDTIIVSQQDAKKGKLPHEDYEFLASINLKKTGRGDVYILSEPEQPSNCDIRSNKDINICSYLSVKNPRNKQLFIGQGLQPGNIVKLGRLSFLVVECRNDVQTNTFKMADCKDLSKKSSSVLTVEKSLTGTCRICLGDQITEDNLLIAACKCSGSCECVHIDCLKIWIDSKIKKESRSVATVYNFTKFQCQLCKSPFPITVQSPSKSIDLMTIERPSKPYLMIESIPDKKQLRQEADTEQLKISKSLYIITADEMKVAKLGRGHQSDIIMDDISVSRNHAEISYRRGQFYVRDMDSKFGTLIELQQKREIADGMKVQCGRSVYTFRMGPKIKTCQYLP